MCLSARTVVLGLVSIAMAFAAIDLVSQAPRYFSFAFPEQQRIDRMFHLGREANVPTWFSTVLLFIAGIMLAVIAGVKRRQADAFRWYWAALAAMFVYLSADEAAVLHEQISGALASYAPGSPLNYGGWIGYGVAAVCGLGLLFLPFVVALPGRTKVLFALAGAVFVGGAIGVEVIALPYENGRPPDYRWSMLVALEETMEITGVALFVGALLDYMRLHVPLVELRFGGRTEGEPAE